MRRSAPQLAEIITNIEAGLVILDRDPQKGGPVILRPSLKRVLRVVRNLRPAPTTEEIEAAVDHLIAEAHAAGELARAANLAAYRLGL